MTDKQFKNICLKELKNYKHQSPKIKSHIISAVHKYHISNQDIGDLATLIVSISTTYRDELFDIFADMLKRSLIDSPNHEQNH